MALHYQPKYSTFAVNPAELGALRNTGARSGTGSDTNLVEVKGFTATIRLLKLTFELLKHSVFNV
jgi:hypothetical protein